MASTQSATHKRCFDAFRQKIADNQQKAFNRKTYLA